MHNAPDSQNPPSGSLTDWEIALIGHVVDGFLSTRESRPGFERDDLVQESLLHWWSQRSRYSAKRGASLRTFLRRVVKAKLLDIELRERAAKRGGYTNPRSLDESVFLDELDTATLADTVADSSHVWSPVSAAEQRASRDGIRRAYLLLSHGQRLLVQRLARNTNKSDLAQRLGVSRETIYAELHRIREVFRDEGLEEHLP